MLMFPFRTPLGLQRYCESQMPLATRRDLPVMQANKQLDEMIEIYNDINTTVDRSLGGSQNDKKASGFLCTRYTSCRARGSLSTYSELMGMHAQEDQRANSRLPKHLPAAIDHSMMLVLTSV